MFTLPEEGKKTVKFRWKGWLAAAAAIVFLVGGTLLTRESMPARTVRTSDGGSAEPSWNEASGTYAAAKSVAANDAGAYAFEEEAMLMDESSAAGDTSGTSESRAEKLIRSASFTIKTTAYDADLENLKQLTASMGGRVEYFSSSGDAKGGQLRSASLTLRIPASRLDEFLEGAGRIGDITGMTQQVEDVSDSYYDIQDRLTTQQEKMKRLQAMISSAQDVSDLIEIETAIADTQYYIDRYTGQLKGYDSKVVYSTVTVSVRETRVTEMQSITLGQRIVSGMKRSLESFGEFLEDLVVFTAEALPWLIALAILILAVRLILRRQKKAKK